MKNECDCPVSIPFKGGPMIEALHRQTMTLRVLQQCRVSPMPASGPRPALPLTFFDIHWLDFNPVERLFFYRFPNSTANFLDSHLPNLKSSLSLTLNNFYPLAGTIRRSSSYDDRFEMCYSDGDSVSLSVCEYADVDFNDVSGYHMRAFKKLLLLVPLLPKSPDAQPLLAIQVTLFPSQGLCLALKIHHAACDGFSSTHFIKSWATACRGTAPPPPPLPSLDRSSISDPHSLVTKHAQIILRQRSHPHHHFASPTSTSLTAATFTLNSHQIRNLKQRLQSKVAEQGNPPFHISTFVVSLACAWTCFVKAKRYDDLSRVAHVFFSVDRRNRMRPPPPANYFGNCLGCPCFVKASVGEIVKEKDGIFVACEVIGKAIEKIGDDVYEGMRGVFEKVMEVLPHKPLSIAGSPKLWVYESDFGWGKPEKVEMTSIGETGAISMAESRDDEGGVEIGVVLLQDEISEFGKQFKKLQLECDV